jgi:hypothetical protein
MTRKEELLKELQELENKKPEEVVVINAPININEINDNINDSIQNTKKPRTVKQQEAFEKARLKMMENTNKRLLEKKQKEEEERKIIEEKLVKKAIAIKKKQIKKEQILEELSDNDNDDEPIQKIKEVHKHPAPETPKPPQIIYRFY